MPRATSVRKPSANIQYKWDARSDVRRRGAQSSQADEQEPAAATGGDEPLLKSWVNSHQCSLSDNLSVMLVD
jgi:hypothetical protein